MTKIHPRKNASQDVYSNQALRTSGNDQREYREASATTTTPGNQRANLDPDHRKSSDNKQVSTQANTNTSMEIKHQDEAYTFTTSRTDSDDWSVRAERTQSPKPCFPQYEPKDRNAHRHAQPNMVADLQDLTLREPISGGVDGNRASENAEQKRRAPTRPRN